MIGGLIEISNLWVASRPEPSAWFHTHSTKKENVMHRGHLVIGGILSLVAWLPSTVPLRAGEVAVPGFYAHVMTTKPQGALGQVIAQEAVATSMANAQAWRIAYISSDLRERPTLSTALVVAPKSVPPKEGRPILVWAHGTTGTAQNCGPSQVLDPAQDINQYFLIGGTSWTDFGVPALSEFISQGYVVVATDYQGLGGGGRHQYSISATQGRDVINSIRAVGSLGLSGGSRKAAVLGWSQGGGATLGAAGLVDYAGRTATAFDGIDIVGYVALAPHDISVLAPKGTLDAAASSDVLQSLAKSFSGNVFNFTHYAMLMWATAAASPEIELPDVFTPEGANALDEVFTFADGYRSVARNKPERPELWVKALLEGSVAAVRPTAPVIIYWGTKDTVVPPVMGELYRKQMCGMGANVARVRLPGEQTHFSTPNAAKPFYVQWISDRFAGKPLPDGCADD